jgi:hypothetical protein
MKTKPIFLCLFLIFTCSNLMAQQSQRPVSELTADISGWEMIKNAAQSAKNKVEFLPVTKIYAAKELLQMQVTTHSYMGAIIYFTGGVFIDNRWIRLLGSGSTNLPRNITDWNKGKSQKSENNIPGYLFIGDDAIGGFFAINSGALGTDIGNIYYLAPDSLMWESLGKGYSAFVEFCFNGDLEMFYKGFRWKGWQKEVSTLNGDKVYSFFPYLWTKEGKNIQKNSRKPIPIEEQFQFNQHAIDSLKH